MNAAAQELIGRVRDLISKQDYADAMGLLRTAPGNRTDWSPQENDEVICLEEFLQNLNDAAFSAQPV